MEHEFRLLVMSQADEVGPHLLDLVQFATCLFIGHGSPHAGMVVVTVGAVQQQSLPVEHERAMLAKLVGAQTEMSADRGVLSVGHSLDLTSI